MKKFWIIILAVMFLGFAVSPAAAVDISLFDWGLNIDGALTLPGDPLPGGVGGMFDFNTGLGTLTATLGGAGAHNVDFFVDHEIDETINTFFNESGAAVGAPGAGQSWEIDEPGYVFGDIYDNFSASTLDNSNGVPVGMADDVSMALGWDFNLAANELAYIAFVLSETAPAGFYLQQTDPRSQADIYFSSSLNIRPIDGPEPATMLLLGSGLVALAGLSRKRLKQI